MTVIMKMTKNTMTLKTTHNNKQDSYDDKENSKNDDHDGENNGEDEMDDINNDDRDYDHKFYCHKNKET